MSNNLTERPNGTVEEKLDWLIAAVQSMDSRLITLDTKVDKRLRETQPMWEAVLTQLAEVRMTLQRHGELLQHQGELLQHHGELLQKQGEDIAALRADTERGFRTIDRRMERQLGEFERLHAYQRDLEDRIERIEKLSNT